MPNATIHIADVSLTSAQIKTLHSSPVALISAPGSGKFINPLQVIWLMTYGTISFDGANPFLALGSTSVGGQMNQFASGFNLIETAFPLIDGPSLPASFFANQPLNVTAPSDSTQGDSTMRVRVLYTIEPAS